MTTSSYQAVMDSLDSLSPYTHMRCHTEMQEGSAPKPSEPICLSRLPATQGFRQRGELC